MADDHSVIGQFIDLLHDWFDVIIRVYAIELINVINTQFIGDYCRSLLRSGFATVIDARYLCVGLLEVACDAGNFLVDEVAYEDNPPW